MRRSFSIFAIALLMASSAAMAAPSPTTVTLHPGENVFNITVAAETPASTTPRIAAPRATCSAYRSANPTSALTRDVCKQAGLVRERTRYQR